MSAVFEHEPRTIPLIYRDEVAECCGDCSQGRRPCPSPMVCCGIESPRLTTSTHRVTASDSYHRADVLSAGRLHRRLCALRTGLVIAGSVIAAAMLIGWAPKAFAATSSADSWGTPDKKEHAALSFAGAAAVTQLTGSKAWGAGSCLALGAAKEVSDMHRPGHTASLKDLAADSIGCALGAFAPGWLRAGAGYIGVRVTW